MMTVTVSQQIGQLVASAMVDGSWGVGGGRRHAVVRSDGCGHHVPAGLSAVDGARSRVAGRLALLEPRAGL